MQRTVSENAACILRSYWQKRKQKAWLTLHRNENVTRQPDNETLSSRGTVVHRLKLGVDLRWQCLPSSHFHSAWLWLDKKSEISCHCQDKDSVDRQNYPNTENMNNTENIFHERLTMMIMIMIMILVMMMIMMIIMIMMMVMMMMIMMIIMIMINNKSYGSTINSISTLSIIH